jgi:hypothetical protein
MMESVFRYIVIIAIAFMIGKEVFQSIRQKSVDWCLLAIIVLFGIVIFMSRSFLVSIRNYGYLEICITVLAISAYLLGRSTKISKLIRGLSIASLLGAILVFTYWNIMAQKIPGEIDIVELNGFTRGRFEEVLFKYDGRPFNRYCSLKDYSSKYDLMDCYNVKLTLKPLYPHIVKLESITLIPKE